MPKPLNPDEVISATVRACADRTYPGGTGLTFSSTLTVNVNPSGFAPVVATFNPALEPKFQDCIARAVYETRWSEPFPHRIPIEIHR